MKKVTDELIGIDLFAGAGGLSLGAEMAGISMQYAVEADTYAAASYSRNFKNATVFCEDIRKLSTEGLKSRPVFIIMGGPPCQGFSLSNTKTRDMSNPNNRMFEEFLRFAEKEGYADETMQIKSIELSRQGLEHTADMQQREITQKCRLSVGLGAMSGLLILLLLV